MMLFNIFDLPINTSINALNKLTPNALCGIFRQAAEEITFTSNATLFKRIRGGLEGITNSNYLNILLDFLNSPEGGMYKDSYKFRVTCLILDLDHNHAAYHSSKCRDIIDDFKLAIKTKLEENKFHLVRTLSNAGTPVSANDVPLLHLLVLSGVDNKAAINELVNTNKADINILYKDQTALQRLLSQENFSFNKIVYLHKLGAILSQDEFNKIYETTSNCKDIPEKRLGELKEVAELYNLKLPKIEENVIAKYDLVATTFNNYQDREIKPLDEKVKEKLEERQDALFEL